MTTNVRGGLALLCVALIALILGLVAGVQLLVGLAVLCGIGGLAAVAVGLVRAD